MAKKIVLALVIATILILGLTAYNSNEVGNARDRGSRKACIDFETEYYNMSYADAAVKCELEG